MSTQTPPIVATSPDKSLRRRFLTFGTRSLFALTALCGIAAGWWTWPYEIEVEVAVEGERYCPNVPRPKEPDIERSPDAPRTPFVTGAGTIFVNRDEPPDISRREIRTMRRTLSDPVQHGRRRVYDSQGNLRVDDYWRFGVRDGRCSEWDAAGRLEAQGNYKSGEVDGKWLSHVDPDEVLQRRFDAVRFENGRRIVPIDPDERGYYDRLESEYRNGEPVGTWRYLRVGRILRERTFMHGNVIRNVSWRYHGDKLSGVFESRVNEARTTRVNTEWAGDRGKKREEIHYGITFEPSEDGRGERLEFGRHKRRLGGYERVEKHGSHRAWYESGGLRFEGSWRKGLAHGPWRFWNAFGRETRNVEFEDGELVRVEGREFPRDSRFQRETNDDWGNVGYFIGELTTVQFNDVPLDSLAQWLKQSLNEADVCFRVAAMSDKGITPRSRFSFECHDLPLGAAVALALEPMGLVTVHRFEQVWITTTDDRWRQHDRTGLSNLRFPPNSKLEAALSDPTTLEFVETPLRDVLDYLQDLHGIPIAVSDELAARIRAGKGPVVTNDNKGITLRSALGRILEQLNLACEIRNDVLTIKLP